MKVKHLQILPKTMIYYTKMNKYAAKNIASPDYVQTLFRYFVKEYEPISQQKKHIYDF